MSVEVYKRVIHFLVEFKFLTYKAALTWMHTANPELQGYKPVDLIKAEKGEEVWKLIDKEGTKDYLSP